MGIAEIIAFVLKIVGWIIGASNDKKEQVKELSQDLITEMKKKSESVKLYKRSIDQSLRARFKRGELKKKIKRKKK